MSAGDPMLDQVRAALAADAVPTKALEQAKALFGHRLEAGLAELLRPVEAQAPELAVAVRGPAQTDQHVWAFEGDQCSLELEVLEHPEGREVHGQVLPAQSVRVQLDQALNSPANGWMDSDELGTFVIGGVGAGHLRLLCQLPGGAVVSTGWFWA